MASTTASLTAEMSVFYDKVFLERAQAMIVYDVGAERKAMERNMGKQVNWTRRSPLAVATTALTEATNPSATEMTSTTVSAAVQPYGAYTQAGTLYELTSIDQGLREHVEVHAQNAAETLDTLIRNELDGGGTSLVANSKAVSAVATSDTLDGADIRRAVRQLKLNKAIKFPNNHFRSVIPVSVVHDLRGDSEWLDAYRYTNAENIRNGLAGRLHGVEFFETNNEMVAANAGAGNVDVYTTFIFGQHAYGTVDIAGESTPRIIVKSPGPQDTSNALDMFSTVGWKAHFATKVLNSDWVIEYKSASSVGDNA
jgi:N4-gp56 family major capsid protein